MKHFVYIINSRERLIWRMGVKPLPVAVDLQCNAQQTRTVSDNNVADEGYARRDRKKTVMLAYELLMGP